MLGDVNDLDHLTDGDLDFFHRPLFPLPAHLVAVPTIVTDELEAFVGDVLGDGGDEVAGAEDLEVAVDLLVHAGAVDDRAIGTRTVQAVDLHLFDCKGIADDLPAVLRTALQAGPPLAETIRNNIVSVRVV